MSEKIILDKKNIARVISRMAHEIIEHNSGIEELVLIGISMGGNKLSERMRDCIERIEGTPPPLGIIDATLYRDDIRSGTAQQEVHQTDIAFSLEGKNVILIDDVLFTGRTIRAALDALMSFGRPNTVQLAVFIDRGHRELPIRADYVGKNIPTARGEKIALELDASGGDRVVITKNSNG